MNIHFIVGQSFLILVVVILQLVVTRTEAFSLFDFLKPAEKETVNWESELNNTFVTLNNTKVKLLNRLKEFDDFKKSNLSQISIGNIIDNSKIATNLKARLYRTLPLLTLVKRVICREVFDEKFHEIVRSMKIQVEKELKKIKSLEIDLSIANNTFASIENDLFQNGQTYITQCASDDIELCAIKLKKDSLENLLKFLNSEEFKEMENFERKIKNQTENEIKQELFMAVKGCLDEFYDLNL